MMEAYGSLSKGVPYTTVRQPEKYGVTAKQTSRQIVEVTILLGTKILEQRFLKVVKIQGPAYLISGLVGRFDMTSGR
jgi:hypothetical protein